MLNPSVLFSYPIILCAANLLNSDSSEKLELLASLLVERLMLMETVASYKMEYLLPIEDLIREQTILKQMRINAEQTGIDPESVVTFADSLMKAGKAAQYRYLADWISSPDTRPLVQELDPIRLQISHLDNRLLREIKNYLDVSHFSAEVLIRLENNMSVPKSSKTDIRNTLPTLNEIRKT